MENVRFVTAKVSPEFKEMWQAALRARGTNANRALNAFMAQYVAEVQKTEKPTA